MSHSVVVGAGATGRAVALQVAATGESVRLVTRRGTGPQAAGIERVALDASDAEAMARVTKGANTLFNCAMPRYDQWPQEFPSLAAGMLAAAERSGAGYVMLGNTYAYAPAHGPVFETAPLAPTTIKGRIRAEIWEQAHRAYEKGRVRATEVRANSFLGHGAYSIYNLMVTPNVLAGKPAQYPGDLDVANSWTFTEDAARTLIAASRSEVSWGRAWHVPSLTGISARALTNRLAELANTSPPRLTRMTAKEVREIGRTDSIIAEVEEILYLSDSPFEMSSAATTEAFAVRASSLDDVLRDTLKA